MLPVCAWMIWENGSSGGLGRNIINVNRWERDEEEEDTNSAVIVFRSNCVSDNVLVKTTIRSITGT